MAHQCRCAFGRGHLAFRHTLLREDQQISNSRSTNLISSLHLLRHVAPACSDLKQPSGLPAPLAAQHATLRRLCRVFPGLRAASQRLSLCRGCFVFGTHRQDFAKLKRWFSRKRSCRAVERGLTCLPFHGHVWPDHPLLAPFVKVQDQRREPKDRVRAS